MAEVITLGVSKHWSFAEDIAGRGSQLFGLWEHEHGTSRPAWVPISTSSCKAHLIDPADSGYCLVQSFV